MEKLLNKIYDSTRNNNGLLKKLLGNSSSSNQDVVDIINNNSDLLTEQNSQLSKLIEYIVPTSNLKQEIEYLNGNLIIEEKKIEYIQISLTENASVEVSFNNGVSYVLLHGEKRNIYERSYEKFLEKKNPFPIVFRNVVLNNGDILIEKHTV